MLIDNHTLVRNTKIINLLVLSNDKTEITLQRMFDNVFIATFVLILLENATKLELFQLDIRSK